MATSGANPTSALLQDMLREKKKAQTHRVRRTYDPANGYSDGRDDRDVQSSPIASKFARDSRRGSVTGARNVAIPKGMGVKETEEYVSKINKQNFDLKLEVFHCRQRNGVLEDKLNKFQELESDNKELQSINEELLLELEKRDIAIQEAVGLICELEAKNEDLQMTVVKMDFTQSSSQPGPESAKEGNEVGAPPLSPTSGKGSSRAESSLQADLQAPSGHSLSAPDTLSPPKAVSPRRLPSFIRDTKKSTNVLRSMYSNDGNASFLNLARPASIVSSDDDDDYIDRQMTNSPRLSILSESGFSSIYGGHRGRTLSNADEKPEFAESSSPNGLSDLPQRDTDRESRLHKWLDKRIMPRTPSPKVKDNDKYSSIGEILSELPETSQDRESAENSAPGQHAREQRTPQKRQGKQTRSPEKKPVSPPFGGPIFGAAVLPPTPDTMSTATMDANSSTPSIITEKSLLDGAHYPANGYSALTPGFRPHTSDSTKGSVSPGSLKGSPRQDMSTPNDTRGTGSGAPMRPSLMSYGTDAFSGASVSHTQASRTLSYPSPTSGPRRLSDQRSSTNHRGSDWNSEMTANPSPKDRLSECSTATVTPPRRIARDDRRSTLTPQHAAAPSAISAVPHLAAPAQAQRSSSLRSKIASKFSRSNGNASRIPNPSSNSQDRLPSKPPVTRAPVSTQHARLPRPASLYGGHPVPSPSPSPPPYELSSMLPGAMLTDLQRYSAGSGKHLEPRKDRR